MATYHEIRDSVFSGFKPEKFLNPEQVHSWVCGQRPAGMVGGRGTFSGIASEAVAAWERSPAAAAWRTESDRQAIAQREAEARRETDVMAWRAWVPGARRLVQRWLRRRGFQRELTSHSGSNYYGRWEAGRGRVRVRIADHEIPQNDERLHNATVGRVCCEAEIVLDRMMDRTWVAVARATAQAIR